MSIQQLQQEFKTKLIDFFDNLIEIFPAEGKLVGYRIILKEMPSKEIFLFFFQKIYPHKQLIKKKEDKFFTEINIFENIGDHSNYMKVIWSTPSLDDDDKVRIWKWMELFVKYMDKYNKMESN